MRLRVVSWDIEVLPGENGKFPVPEESPVLMISCTLNEKVNLYDFNGESNDYDDIESDNIIFLLRRNKIPEVITKNDRIVIEFLDEKMMINRFIDFIKWFNPSIITGYNSNGFDFPYIIDRGKILGINNIKIGLGDSNLYYRKYLSKGMQVAKIGGVTGRILFDVYYVLRREDASNTFLKKYNLKRLKLGIVAKEILGEGKLDFTPDEMIDYWNNNDDEELVSRFVDYCSKDSWLAMEFVRRFRMLDRFFMLSNKSGKIPQAIIDSMGSGLMVDNLMIKEFKLRDRVMPCRNSGSSYKDDDDKDLMGAYVKAPDVGITDNIGSVDYKSLYPTLMIKHNLSYDTVILNDLNKNDIINSLDSDDIQVQEFEDGKEIGKFVRREKYVGILPTILTSLLNERFKLKKKMKTFDKNSVDYLMLDAAQNAVKILLNSHYGYSGDKRAKIYSWKVASSVTNSGRIRIIATAKQIEEEIGTIKYENIVYKLDVVASDTDSCYVKVSYINDKDIIENKDIKREVVLYCVDYVIKEVNKRLEKPMELAFEEYIKRILVVAKKRYAMLTEDENGNTKVISKGIETVRRDWTDMTTETFGKIIDILLYEKDVNVGVSKSIDVVKNKIDELKNGEVGIEKLILTNKLTKPITSYDNKEPHVSVAIKMAERGKKSDVGNRIEYIITDNGEKLISNRAEEADYVIKNNIPIDIDYYINNQLIKPITRVTSLFGITKEILDIKLDDEQNTLSEFF